MLKELGIFTFSDLLNHFPYRHVDETRVSLIRDIYPNTEYIKVAGKIISCEILGEKEVAGSWHKSGTARNWNSPGFRAFLIQNHLSRG
jgi:RecG-like helicase